MPSMSLHATLTLPLPLWRTASSAGCCSRLGCFVLLAIGFSVCVFRKRVKSASKESKGGRAACDVHLRHRIGHRRHGLAHLVAADRADAADSKAFQRPQLAREE